MQCRALPKDLAPESSTGVMGGPDPQGPGIGAPDDTVTSDKFQSNLANKCRASFKRISQANANLRCSKGGIFTFG